MLLLIHILLFCHLLVICGGVVLCVLSYLIYHAEEEKIDCFTSIKSLPFTCVSLFVGV